jgi:hypothetical protein
MSAKRRSVNPFPPNVPVSRLEELLGEYRRILQARDLPTWYCTAIIAAIESSLNDQAVGA